MAVEEGGAVELDDPAGPPGATVAHLLAHASGLAFDSRDIEAGGVAEKRIYSSAGGFEILAETVEQAAGIAFPEYLADAVSAPLGLESTELHGPAGHGARSSTADLARFAQELLAPQILAPETLADATSVQFPGLDGSCRDTGGIVPTTGGAWASRSGRRSLRTGPGGRATRRGLSGTSARLGLFSGSTPPTCRPPASSSPTGRSDRGRSRCGVSSTIESSVNFRHRNEVFSHEKLAQHVHLEAQ